MAVLITEEARVKTVSPNSKTFTLEELNSIVDGWIEPVKIGPVWVIYKQDLKSGPLNDIASRVFQVALRGKVLVVPVQQLPAEWDLMEEEDQNYTAEVVDCGFLISLQTMLITSSMNDEGLGIYGPDGSALFSPRMIEAWINWGQQEGYQW